MRSLSIKERIERNVTVWLLGTLLTGFVAGVSAYRIFREIIGYQEITKVEVDELKRERKKANSAKINFEKQLSDAKKQIESLRKLRPTIPAIKKDSKVSASAALNGVSVSIYFKAGRAREAVMMKEKLVTAGAKAKAVEKRLPPNRDAVVVYYQHRDKLQAAMEVVKLFPKMKLKEKFEDTARTIYEEDVYLFLQ